MPVTVAPLKVVIADDHPIVLKGLETLLSHEPDIVCCGVVESADQVFPLVERENPGALIVDLNMPGLSTLSLINELKVKKPELRVAVLTMHVTGFAMMEVFKAGAHAFIAKNDACEVLVDVLRRMRQGETEIRSPSLEALLKDSPVLTPRERQVLEGLAQGLSGKEISDKLGISLKTMELYRTKILRKFHLTKATELVRVAIDSGVVRPLLSEPS